MDSNAILGASSVFSKGTDSSYFLHLVPIATADILIQASFSSHSVHPTLAGCDERTEISSLVFVSISYLHFRHCMLHSLGSLLSSVNAF